MNQKIRLFIAIELPEGVKDVLTETAVRLSKNVPDGAVRWVNRAQMHLTLRFLGDTAVAQLPALQINSPSSRRTIRRFSCGWTAWARSRTVSGRGWCRLGWRGELAVLQPLQAGAGRAGGGVELEKGGTAV